jgi:tyrosyl-tRNA synthetase
MGKSLGNYIGIGEPPYEMVKKFMQLPDVVMPMYFELLTDLPQTEVARLLAGHPKQAKLALARSIIGQYYDPQSADEAAAQWEREISKKEMPAEIPVLTLSRAELHDGKIPAANLLKLTGLCQSTSDARRTIGQGGAFLGENKEKIESHDRLIAVEDGLLVWVGKKRFGRIELTD